MINRLSGDVEHLADQVANIVVRGECREKSNGELNDKTLQVSNSDLEPGLVRSGH